MSGPVVTQADREAYNCLMQDEHYDYEPAGAWHFARHRQQAEATASAANAALVAELVSALQFLADQARATPGFGTRLALIEADRLLSRVTAPDAGGVEP